MANRRNQDKKAQEEQEAAAYAFQEFVNTFQNDYSNVGKTFVRSGVLYADKNKFETSESQMYKPKPLIQTNNTIKNAIECATIVKQHAENKKKAVEKPKSNLELLKEELKQRHSERGDRERIKAEVLSAPPALSYFEGGDPHSTNLFVANLSTNITESDLMREFGVFGALASVKIMWPRGEERNKLFGDTNCGFVAYMSRKDAIRALSVMKCRQDMRVGWGKSVELPANPIYIPQELLEYYMPPTLSGLPYNAQPDNKNTSDHEDFDDLLYNSTVKVTVPLNKKLLMLVNRTVEYVVREGPMFEAMIMNNEIRNPEFSFLFDYKSPIHVYYRWKLFSVLQGDSVKQWEMNPFRMFKGGSVWIPPTTPDYSNGMPDELIRKNENFGGLSDNQCDRLVQLIQELNLRKIAIAEAMVFCLQHSNAIEDSIAVLTQSLDSKTADPPKKIARLFLLSDVLYNCNKEDIGIDFDKLEIALTEIFGKNFVKTYNELKTGDKEVFRSKVLRVFRQWDSIPIFSVGAIQDWEKLFPNAPVSSLDEESSSDEPLDGASLLKRSLNSESEEIVIPKKEERVTKANEALPMQYFVPSKWDTVNPEDVESQAVNSEKIFYMQAKNDIEKHFESISSSSSDDEHYIRKKRREIEKRDADRRERKMDEMSSGEESFYYRDRKRRKSREDEKQDKRYDSDRENERKSVRGGKKKKSDRSDRRKIKKDRKD